MSSGNASTPDQYGALAGVTQTILHDPEMAEVGVYGNCLQAAVATVLGLPLDAVPHFVTFEWWPQAMTLWAYGRGLKLGGGRTNTIPERRCIVGGKSARGVNHVVVGEHGQVVWDPHPSRDGLVAVTDVTWFESMNEHEPCPFLWGPVVAAAQLEHVGYTVIAPASGGDEPGRTTDPHACCKRHIPGPVFVTFVGRPTPEYICPECGGRWLWDDDEAEGGSWYWDPDNDRADAAHIS